MISQTSFGSCDLRPEPSWRLPGEYIKQNAHERRPSSISDAKQFIVDFVASVFQDKFALA